MNTKAYKVILAGDGAVGKTTYVNRHKTGEFTREYLPTFGAEIVHMVFYTTHGKVSLNVWDTAGQEKFGGLRDGYYIGADAAILMFDVTNRMTYKNIPTWYRDIVRVCGNIPMVIVGNKCDVKNRAVKPKNITFHRKKNLQYYDLSVRSNYNYEKPFLHIMKKFANDSQLGFVQQPAVKPPEVLIDAQEAFMAQQEIEKLANIPVPDSDDNDLLD